MSAHTPGTWIAAPYSSVVGAPVVASPSGRPVANVTYFGLGEAFKNHDAESAANGRLIAAAPDLLAACVEFVRKVDAGEARSTRTYAEMKAAIAKATAA